MVKAIRIHAPGGPEVLKYEDVEVPAPGPGEVLLRQKACGLNYIDVYHRMGVYPLHYPAVIGMEGMGVVEAVGEGVTAFKPGERVAYADLPPGAYAQARVMPWHRLVKLPDAIDDKTAGTMMLQGMTVEYLIRRTYKVQKGDTVLFHAAAGGVGLIACQWLNHIGATVIGTVGSEEKAALAKAYGCHHTINYRKENFVERVKELTDGKGVPVVYDSVGKDTFEGSLDCLRPRGMMVLFGAASGPAPAIDPNLLNKKGCLYLTRPSLMVYNKERSELEACAAALFDMVTSGKVKIEVNQSYPLKEAAQAHRDLEARKTTGSTVLLP